MPLQTPLPLPEVSSPLQTRWRAEAAPPAPSAPLPGSSPQPLARRPPSEPPPPAPLASSVAPCAGETWRREGSERPVRPRVRRRCGARTPPLNDLQFADIPFEGGLLNVDEQVLSFSKKLLGAKG
uniref:Uncharacterized protein n=1 Tax=Myotis myotis TaxID=51298 RepID=A0A7J7ZXE9_MYOMY|nr:hypothetical protein mMyoMyo1_009671 [Myotis myotis]